MTGETMIRSLGHGVYLAESKDAETARSAVGAVSPVLEAWPDPEGAGRHTVVTEGGHPTSRYEAGVSEEDGVLESVLRSAESSPPGSALRLRLRLVTEALDGLRRGGV